jgi:hypothetical protein
MQRPSTGDDIFSVRAFARMKEDGSGEEIPEEPKNTDVEMGNGNDYIEYVINAPVDIDGGAGFDKLALIATEFNDKFVVTKNGIYGYACWR